MNIVSLKIVNIRFHKSSRISRICTGSYLCGDIVNKYTCLYLYILINLSQNELQIISTLED